MAHYGEEKPLNRIFILGGKGATEEEWQETFSQYGDISNIWITKNHTSGDQKGITYITFEKTSAACKAIEGMNGKWLPNHNSEDSRALKVILASDKREGSGRKMDEDKMLLRLFIKIPHEETEEDIKHHFQNFGEIDYVRLIKDRNSGKSKGLGYVKYYKQSEGSRALEECDPKYKPIFADSKPKDDERPRDGYDYGYSDRRGGPPPSRGSQSRGPQSRTGGAHFSGDRGSSGGGYQGPQEPNYRNNGAGSMGPAEMLRGYTHWGECRLEAMMADILDHDHVYKLFDLIPGLEVCRYDRQSGMVTIEYSSPQCAAYCRDKINGMEYPPGYRISVRSAGSSGGGGGNMAMDSYGALSSLSGGMNSSMSNINAGMGVKENLSHLVESIQKATQVLQTAGIDTGLGLGGLRSNDGMRSNVNDELRWCNVSLPPKKPFASRDADVAERLFIVSGPNTFPDSYLEDAFCRFGDLISVFFMPGKTFGYAKYATKECAERAMEALHGQTVCGQRLKVLLADPPKYEVSDRERDGKRQRQM